MAIMTGVTVFILLGSHFQYMALIFVMLFLYCGCGVCSVLWLLMVCIDIVAEALWFGFYIVAVGIYRFVSYCAGCLLICYQVHLEDCFWFCSNNICVFEEFKPEWFILK